MERNPRNVLSAQRRPNRASANADARFGCHQQPQMLLSLHHHLRPQPPQSFTTPAQCPRVASVTNGHHHAQRSHTGPQRLPNAPTPQEQHHNATSRSKRAPASCHIADKRRRRCQRRRSLMSTQRRTNDVATPHHLRNERRPHQQKENSRCHVVNCNVATKRRTTSRSSLLLYTKVRPLCNFVPTDPANDNLATPHHTAATPSCNDGHVNDTGTRSTPRQRAPAQSTVREDNEAARQRSPRDVLHRLTVTTFATSSTSVSSLTTKRHHGMAAPHHARIYPLQVPRRTKRRTTTSVVVRRRHSFDFRSVSATSPMAT
jgi:hypothetical protein